MSAFDTGVREGMEKAAAAVAPAARRGFIGRMMSKATGQTLEENRGLISDVVDEAIQRTFSSDNSTQLINNTFKKSWKSLVGAGLAVGAGVGIGAGISYRLSQMKRNPGIDSGPGLHGRMTYPVHSMPPMVITMAPDKGVRGYEGRLRSRSS